MQFEESETGIDPLRPLIYLWQVRDSDGCLVYAYVGKAKRGAKRPRKHYARNVRNLLSGQPYRKSKPAEFRRVHRELARAVNLGHQITLTFLCNVSDGENIDEVERQLHDKYATS